MRPQWLCCIVLFAVASYAPAQEAIAKSKIVSVGLFKNGLAVVKREVQIPKEGTYRLDASPEPVHGSFWIESDGKVEAAVKMRDVEAPLHAEGGMRLQSDLAGKQVTLTFRNDKLGSVTGTFVKLVKPERPEGMASVERPGLSAHSSGGPGIGSIAPLPIATRRSRSTPQAPPRTLCGDTSTSS